MQTITINNVEYTITFTDGGVEVQYFDEVVQLDTVILLKLLGIKKGGIETHTEQYHISPNGERINRKQFRRDTPEADYQAFIQSDIASLIQKYIANGIFRFIIGATDKVYHMDGTLIPNQPQQISQ